MWTIACLLFVNFSICIIFQANLIMLLAQKDLYRFTDKSISIVFFFT